MSEYEASLMVPGHKWPLITTPMIHAQIIVKAPLDLTVTVEGQMRQMEQSLRAVLPPDIEINVYEVEEFSLSAEDQAERDCLDSLSGSSQIT